MSHYEPWIPEFQTRYYELTGHLLVIQPGQDPAHDVALVEHIGPGRNYWFLYEFDTWDTEYWSIFLALFRDHPGLDLHVSSALVLSERIFGSRVFELSVPDVWVLTVEALPITVNNAAG
jgi:hypothetical protein